LTRRSNHNGRWFLFAGILLIVQLCVGAGGLSLASRAYGQRYADRIYPGVSVYGVDLSGMTVEEATTALQAALPEPSAMPLVLRDGEHSWNRSWAELGIHIDPNATARLAYQVGRRGTAGQMYGERLEALLAGWMLSPIVVLPNPAQAAAALEPLANETLAPPVNASLLIQPEGITPIPAQAGRELDVEATVAALPHAIHVGPEGLLMQLLTRQVQPAITNASQAHAEAEALLAQPFALVAEDRLTDFSATWTIEPATVAEWLTVREIVSDEEARLELTVQEEPIRATLENLNGQLAAEEIALDVERTATAVEAAVEAGESQAAAVLMHPQRTYLVQPGDTLTSIAWAHGFPVWRLIEANPGIEPGGLHTGQQITIPSIDVLFPLPLITERRIVVDISDQRLYAYEGETLIHDYLCSTGIASSPTIAGTFQILSKEEEAYASSWDLWMPHFMGIYRSGPNFTNGIHGLPTLSGGGLLWEGYLGSPVSYGCIVIGLDEAAALYEWAELGALVTIQD